MAKPRTQSRDMREAAPLFDLGNGFKVRPKSFRKTALPGAAPGQGLVVDWFAGGGGASTSLELGLGRSCDLAINHDEDAIVMHEANHPDCRHLHSDVYEVDIAKETRGRPVDVAWYSPDCRHFSLARGGVPVKKSIRGLAWVVVRTAAALGKNKPKVLFIENVKEFQSWGSLMHFKGKVPEKPYPAMYDSLTKSNQQKFREGYRFDDNGGRVMIPDPKNKGKTFAKFVAQLRSLGYVVQWREINAADFGAPTNRRRLFIVARCDGNAIRWPKPTHGPGRRKPFRTAAECIDFSRPAPSIFLDKSGAAELRKRTGIRCNRPLAPKTLFRVANGIMRYVVKSKRPFIVRTGHFSNITGAGGGFRGQGVDQPLGTVCGINDKALVAPYLVSYYGMSKQGTGMNQPCPTVVGKDRFGLATPYLIRTNHGTTPGTDEMRGQQLNTPIHTLTGSHGTGAVVPVMVGCSGIVGVGGRAGQTPPTAPDKPVGTITGKADKATVAVSLTKFFGGVVGQPVTEPAPTVTGVDHTGVVAAHLVQYNGEKGGNHVRGQSVEDPINTIPGDNRFAVSACTLTKIGQQGGGGVGATPADAPLGTIVSKNEHCATSAHLVKFRGDSIGTSVDEPVPTITGGGDCARPAGAAHALGLSSASMVYLNKESRPGATGSVDSPLNTVTAGGLHAGTAIASLAGGVTDAEWKAFHHVWNFLKEQLGPDAPAPIVHSKGNTYLIVDIGLRMLVPRELLRAQFSPKLAKHYILTGTDANQVKKIGNSVSPLPAAALIRANCGPEYRARARAKAVA